MGLIDPTPESVLQIACVFSAYHAVRRRFKEMQGVFTHDMHSISGPLLRTAWTVFADTFLVEASEVSLSCRRSSVPSFLAFLNSRDPLTVF